MDYRNTVLDYINLNLINLVDTDSRFEQFHKNFNEEIISQYSFKKIDSLQPWVKEYCQEGGSVPSSNSLQRRYLPIVYQNKISQPKKSFF
ncbi:hypothetical protein C2G38_2163726 [Gigaspora rosea]|uniref:Uncharacterized protein n=1 Tax=Gigaspora rosea TaxID=44941 RepID=A0A397VWW0_9GLOM|nr:hypothetical protein C2G38_2163726 [Gigaspora rosea]